MQIIHHGAVTGVTGSCHELVIDAANSLLVDCGLFQGAETSGNTNQYQLAIEFDVSNVQALLVTHCHIDHVGRIPYLLAAGFTGPIYASTATAALLPMVIEDALKVGVTRNKNMIKACLNRLSKQVVAVPYRQWQLLPEVDTHQVKIKFQPAGHILGSAYIEVDVLPVSDIDSSAASPTRRSLNKSNEAESNSHSESDSGLVSTLISTPVSTPKTHINFSTGVSVKGNKSIRIVFSGDLGATYTPLLAAPRSPYRADVVVIESTYGDRVHQGRKARQQQLQAVIKKAIADKGIVIIPAFSIGRTQELLYEIEQIISRSGDKQISQLEVIVDSPMAAKFTDHYKKFQSLWDAEAKRVVREGRNPLDFDSLYTVNSHQEHLATIDYLAKRNKSAIVIAASGMCAGGRVVNYLKRFLSESSTDVLFVGYQAKGTPGRDIQRFGHANDGYVMLDGQKVDIAANIHTISGYSAHADKANLVNYIKRIRVGPEKVIIVHGDDEAKASLKNSLMPLVGEVVIGV
ncbi:MBL fold metallo-hydrolase RNA specificity domain-containing protein [Shewanella sp. 6_MG-2023]|uniref:MBL fold metallo-hydrolase RNA specificity domain-containing protein n=1 Tax=Shewanella sp. 6_MG-2023 TaxID=3062660 RepID=UPI0026E25664|nr:MBL fold metallo-hydrolase [Shewanella sp. 6_MG-2023]MDO6617630.1 MBL fold metallo-hydrolase [Shewanella sp. 6_MG-2023]